LKKLGYESVNITCSQGTSLGKLNILAKSYSLIRNY